MRKLFPLLFAQVIQLSVSGCAYRLLAANPPSQRSLKILAAAPETYSIRVDFNGTNKAYGVGTDGDVDIDVPALRRGCDVYLFNVVKIRSAQNPFREKSIQMMRGADVVRKLSLDDIARLPVDADGHRLLRLK